MPPFPGNFFNYFIKGLRKSPLNVEAGSGPEAPHIGKCRKARKNTNDRRFFPEKNRQKKLDKGGRLWYISQARLRETAERAKRTLKTIQKRETRKKERSAKIPKS
jgi:hypothetical protein